MCKISISNTFTHIGIKIEKVHLASKCSSSSFEVTCLTSWATSWVDNNCKRNLLDEDDENAKEGPSIYVNGCGRSGNNAVSGRLGSRDGILGRRCLPDSVCKSRHECEGTLSLKIHLLSISLLFR